MDGGTLKDSGARQEFSTGSRRDLQAGKGMYELLQEIGLHAVAKQLERGAVKYGHRNWEKGQPLSRYIGSARRHLAYLMMGLRDEPHAAAAAWNVLCFIQTKALIDLGRLPQELDDMPAALSPEEADALLEMLGSL